MNLESHSGHVSTTRTCNRESSLYQKSALSYSSTKIETEHKLPIPHTEEELRQQISAQLFQFNPIYDKPDPQKQFQQLSQEFVMHEMITEDERRKFYNEHVQEIANDNLEVIDPSLPCDMCSFIYEHAFQLIGHSKMLRTRVLDNGLNEILQLNSHKLMVHEMHQVLLKPRNGKVDCSNSLNRYIVSNIAKWLIELHQRYQRTKQQQKLLDKNCNQPIITDNWLIEQRQMYLYAVEMQNKNFEEQKQMYIGNATNALVTGNEIKKSANMGDTQEADSSYEIFLPSQSIRCTDNKDELYSKTNLSSKQHKHSVSITIPNKIALQIDSSEDKSVNNTYQQITPSSHGVMNSESQYSRNSSLLPTSSYHQQLMSSSHPIQTSLHTDSLSNISVSQTPITNVNTIITSSNTTPSSSDQHCFNTPSPMLSSTSCSQLQMYPNECSQIPAASNFSTNHQFVPRYITTTTMNECKVQSSCSCKYNSNYITPDLIYGPGHTSTTSLPYSLPKFYGGMTETGDTPSTTTEPGIAGYINQIYNPHPGFTIASQPPSLPNFTDSMREIGKKIKTLQDLNIKHPKPPIYPENHFAERLYNETASIPQYNVKHQTSMRSPSLMYNTNMSYNEHYQNQLRIYDEYNYLQNRLHNASPLLFPKTHGGKWQKRSNNIRNSPWNY